MTSRSHLITFCWVFSYAKIYRSYSSILLVWEKIDILSCQGNVLILILFKVNLVPREFSLAWRRGNKVVSKWLGSSCDTVAIGSFLIFVQHLLISTYPHLLMLLETAPHRSDTQLGLAWCDCFSSDLQYIMQISTPRGSSKTVCNKFMWTQHGLNFT